MQGIGYPAPPPRQYAQSNGNAVAALVCGILTALIGFCFPLGIVALWLGAKARREAKEAGEPSNSSNNTMALIGMILGAVFGGIYLLILLVYVGMFLLVGVAAFAA